MVGRSTAVLVLAALLAGCGGDDGMKPPTQSGSFDPGEETVFVTESDQYVDLFIEGGRYHIHTKNDSPCQAARTVFPVAYPDVRFEATMTQVADTGGEALHAVGCWNGDAGYLLQVSSSGEVAIVDSVSTISGVQRLLYGPELVKTLRPVGQANRLRIDCLGGGTEPTLVSGWVNGVPIATVEVPDGIDGFPAVGFWAGSETGELDVEVDDWLWVAERQEPSLVPTRPSTTIAPAVEGAGLVWTRVPHDEAVFGGSLVNSVVAGGPGLVAVGATAAEGGDADGGVWLSADGRAWARVDATALGGPGDQWVNSVVAGGPGLVAVGRDVSGGDEDGAVWVSADGGHTWVRIPHDEDVFGGTGDQVVESVAAGGPGVVAVGWEHSSGGSDAAVWVSADGYTWTRIHHDEAIFGGFLPEIAAVTAGGPGLVAGGLSRDGVVWVSADGDTWTRIDDETIFGGDGAQDIRAVAAGGPGVVAAGWESPLSCDEADCSQAAVWVSADGYAWTRIPHDGAVFGGPGSQRVDSLAAWGAGVVAAGAEELGDMDAAVWVSADGYSWTRIPHDEAVFGGPGDQRIMGMAAGGPGLVAVGGDQSGGESHAAIWVATPSSQ